MPDATGRPRRKRLSLGEPLRDRRQGAPAGNEPAAGRGQLGRAPLDRLPPAGPLRRRRLGRPARAARRCRVASLGAARPSSRSGSLAARAASRYGPARLGAILGIPPRRWPRRWPPAMDAHACPGPRGRRWCLRAGPARASCCTWTPSAWGAFTQVGKRDPHGRHPALAPGRLAAPARGRRRPQPHRLLRGAGRPGRRGLLRLPWAGGSVQAQPAGVLLLTVPDQAYQGGLGARPSVRRRRPRRRPGRRGSSTPPGSCPRRWRPACGSRCGAAPSRWGRGPRSPPAARGRCDLWCGRWPSQRPPVEMLDGVSLTARGDHRIGAIVRRESARPTPRPAAVTARPAPRSMRK